jgi:hypothetical protein
MLLRRLPMVLVLLAGVAFPRTTVSASRAVAADCTLKGKKLFGKIKVVTAFPDLKVQVVDSFPDLKVQIVDSFPDKCGRWKVVETFPDLTVQFVTSFPDLKIKFVSSFPGLP